MSEPRCRILFVDDESAVLDALSNALRRQRSRWDTVFALGGAEAISLMGVQRFDIVVTDMRMPGMDGAELMGWVRRYHPHAVRFVLSGQATHAAVERAMPLVHQYLTKPCDIVTLTGILERTWHFASSIEDPRIREQVGRLSALPSQGSTRAAVIALADDPAIDPRRLAARIACSVAISASILQLANSDYFGHGSTITSILRAVEVVGAEGVRARVGSMCTPHVEPADVVPGWPTGYFRHRAIVRARIAEQIAPGPDLRATAYSAGLLLRVGRVAMLQAAPDRYELALAAQGAGQALHLAERAAFGVDQAAVGAQLMGMWGLPRRIVDLVAAQHSGAPSDDELLAVVRAADVLSRSTTCEISPDLLAELADVARAHLLDPAVVDHWRRAAESVLTELHHPPTGLSNWKHHHDLDAGR